jgi:hypothetical protein
MRLAWKHFLKEYGVPLVSSFHPACSAPKAAYDWTKTNYRIILSHCDLIFGHALSNCFSLALQLSSLPNACC